MEKQNNDTEKLTDKAFSRLMLTSVLGILMCMACLCSATWAWFNAGVEASGNKVQSGSFGLDVEVFDSTGEKVAVIEQAGGKTICVFSQAGLYSVSLETSDDTTVSKGFCDVTAAGKRYNTSLIKKDESNPFCFSLDVRSDNLTVIFSPAWGIPSSYDVPKDGTLALD